MKRDDIIYACGRIAGISAIPIRLYDNHQRMQVFCLPEAAVDPVLPYEALLLDHKEHVSYYITPFNQYYGCIRHKEFSIIPGPIGIDLYTPQQRHDYAFELGISMQEFDRLYTKMRSIPAFPLENFLHLLLLMNFYFNNEKKGLEDIAPFMGSHIRQPLSKDNIMADTLDESRTGATPSAHNALEYERRMLGFIRTGDETGIHSFFMTQIHGGEGRLAGSQLRQHKNLFIVSATLASRAAVEGGLTEDEAMALSDYYIRRCEELFSVDAISGLQYQMMMDYTHRVPENINRAPLSPLVSSAVTYIRQNISAQLNGQALAGHFSVSRKTLCLKFKTELGQSVGDYILSERIRRAKELLKNTDHSLAEIANYLAFSSQSHFQGRFKAATGMTPGEYRKNPIK